MDMLEIFFVGLSVIECCFNENYTLFSLNIRNGAYIAIKWDISDFLSWIFFLVWMINNIVYLSFFQFLFYHFERYSTVAHEDFAFFRTVLDRPPQKITI